MSIQNLFRSDLPGGANYEAAFPGPQSTIRLHSNESPWPPFEQDRLELNRYPNKQPAELVNRLAGIYDVNEEQLLVTRGADDGIDLLVRSFCRPGQDAIIQCPPTFVMYQFFATLHGQSVLNVGLSTDGFQLRVDSIIDQLQKSADSGRPAKLIFICSPNNPTGKAMDAASIARIADAAEEQAIVVVDEAYQEFAKRPSVTRLLGQYDNIVVLRTLSKAFGLAGARLGITISNVDIANYLRGVLPPFPLSKSSIDAAMTATSQNRSDQVRKRINEIVERREQMMATFKQLPMVQDVFESDGNFLLLRVANSAKLIETCLENGILIRNQSEQPGLDDCVRVSIGSQEEMDRLMQVFRVCESTA